MLLDRFRTSHAAKTVLRRAISFGKTLREVERDVIQEGAEGLHRAAAGLELQRRPVRELVAFAA